MFAPLRLRSLRDRPPYQDTGQTGDRNMAAFTCDHCGKCCGSFGSFIRIERRMSDRDYYCRYSLTGDIFPVHVDAAYAGEVSGHLCGGELPQAPAGKTACPFLCHRQDRGGFDCAVYATRPPVCRDFRCYRMLVYDNRGNLLGRVIGAGEIGTGDAALRQLWNECIAAVPHAHPAGSNDPVWVKKVRDILAASGYRGDAVD